MTWKVSHLGHCRTQNVETPVTSMHLLKDALAESVEIGETDRAQSVAHLRCGLQPQLQVFGYEIPLIGVVDSLGTAAVSADCHQAIQINVSICIGGGCLRVRPLDNQNVGDHEPIPGFQQVNPHSIYPEDRGTGALIRLFPHLSGTQYSAEGIGISRFKNIRNGVKQVRAEDYISGKSGSAVRSSEAIPGWIAVHDSELRIYDVADR